MKKVLREVIEKYNLDVRITPNQNLILCDIRRAWKRPITTMLAQGGLLVRFLFEYHLYCHHKCYCYDMPVAHLHLTLLLIL